MKSLFSFVFLSIAVVTAGYAQNDKKDPIQQAVNDKQYVFRARTVLPASGPTRQLTSEYDFTVNHDSIKAFLPYFGRAYSAPIGKPVMESILPLRIFHIRLMRERKVAG